MAVARQDEAIVDADGKNFIEDLRSGCGTKVNGRRCIGPTELRNGDLIRVAGN
jgi:pSer/pThr/pTyr-binding forkhead associated (FHA) protein